MYDDEIIIFRQDIKGNKINKYSKEQKKFNYCIIVKYIILLIILLYICDIQINKVNKEVKDEFDNNNDNIDINDENLLKNENNKLNDIFQAQDKKIENCEEIDPINLYEKRIKNGPINICLGKNTKHICYANINNYYNEIFAHKNGVICLMENIILDPSKSEQSGFSYQGPVDSIYLGFPILNKGFFNTKCTIKNNFENYNEIYKTYFNSWNYNYNKKETLDELAPNKTILFISRNQDSPNLYHGNSEIINIISIMNLFNLIPEEIQIIFLESIEIKQDPFYDIYKNMISRGGEPIYIKNLKKKYKISKAIHVPINWDSPAYLNLDFPQCKTPTKTYKLYNDLVNKYLNIKKFLDLFIFKSTKEIFYYPKQIINAHNLNKNLNFTKKITIQWRRVWPKGRTGQFRILGNGKQLADKLVNKIPKNKNKYFLVRLVDTGKLSLREQISIIKDTDYFVGIHGAGLSLGIFLPKESIFHEVLHSENLKVLAMMSAMSGHITYSDIIEAKVKNINDNEYIFFNENEFAEKVLKHMKENNYF